MKPIIHEADLTRLDDLEDDGPACVVSLLAFAIAGRMLRLDRGGGSIMAQLGFGQIAASYVFYEASALIVYLRLRRFLDARGRARTRGHSSHCAILRAGQSRRRADHRLSLRDELSVPTSIEVGTGRMVALGALLPHGNVIRAFQQVFVALDKTAKLTEGQPRLADFAPASSF